MINFIDQFGCLSFLEWFHTIDRLMGSSTGRFFISMTSFSHWLVLNHNHFICKKSLIKGISHLSSSYHLLHCYIKSIREVEYSTSSNIPSPSVCNEHIGHVWKYPISNSSSLFELVTENLNRILLINFKCTFENPSFFDFDQKCWVNFAI